MLDFDGAIMTDSGSFQLAEYGEIDTTTEEILQFQRDIGTDIATPVDIPTPPDVARERPTTDLEIDQTARHAAAVDTGEMLVSAPVQGATYPDLRERAAADAVSTGLDVFPLGAVVPLMNEYRYADLADVVAACKRGLGDDAPVHLFGAGHPMMLALAVALGCDLFDSAAYALYARDDRYLTVQGTELLDELSYFPCHCPVCTDHTPADLDAMDADAREELLARHNLHVTFGELRPRQAGDPHGDLMELVESAPARTRRCSTATARFSTTSTSSNARPRLEGRVLLRLDESARRPEVRRHQDRLERLPVEGEEVLLTEGRSVHGMTRAGASCPRSVRTRANSRHLPLTAETPVRTDRALYEAAAQSRRLATWHPTFRYTGPRRWPATALERVPEGARLRDLHARDDRFHRLAAGRLSAHPRPHRQPHATNGSAPNPAVPWPGCRVRRGVPSTYSRPALGRSGRA